MPPRLLGVACLLTAGAFGLRSIPAASNWKVGAEGAAGAGAMAGAPGTLEKEPKLKLAGALAAGAVEVCIVTAG